MKRLAAVLLGSVLAASCAGSSSPPTQPTSARTASIPSASASLRVESATAGFAGVGVAPGDLGRCLAGSGSPACYTAMPLRVQSAVAGAIAPGVPTDLTATSSGSSVTLAWSAPAGGDPAQSYVIEAGTASGLANLVSFSTGNTATTFSASGVGNGTYYVRVRASNSAGISSPSNESVLVVGSTACTAAPGIPGNLSGTASASGTVVLTWTAASGTPTSYVIEAGSATGLANLANSDLGGAALTYTANNVGGGTYYVRVRAKNACGVSSQSNEFRLVVSTTTSSTVTVTSVSPTSGSAAGGTSVTISGSGFKAGAAVTVGGTAATNVAVVSATSITATTPPHAAGAADVIVTNADGQSARLANAYTYTSSTINTAFNGTWIGFTPARTRVQVIIQSGTVVNLNVTFGEGTCVGLLGTAGPVNAAVSAEGAFSASLGTLVSVTGAISGSNVSGKVTSSLCAVDTTWTGTKQ